MKNEWDLKKISDVCEIVNGGTPDTSKQQYWGGNILWITPKDLGKIQGIFVQETARKITEMGLKNSSAKLLPVNSVILSSRAPIGHLAIAKREISTNQGCKGLIPKNTILPVYLYYFLKSSIDLLNSLGQGTTFKELSSTSLARVKIPVPSLTEQQRIVAILDETFTAIDKAKEYTEKNYQNMQELFTAFLQSVFYSTPDGWEERALGDIAFIKGGKRVPKGYKLLTSPTRHPYIRVTDFREDGTVETSDIHYVSDDVFKQISEYTISTSDVYVSIAGTIGKTGIIPPELNNANLTENACKIVFKEEIDPKYFYYFTKTKSFSNQAGLNTRVTAMPKLALSRLSTIKIRMTRNIETQKNIVRRLDDFHKQVVKQANIYQKKKIYFDELRRSILQKAFSGEI